MEIERGTDGFELQHTIKIFATFIKGSHLLPFYNFKCNGSCFKIFNARNQAFKL